MRLGLLRSYRDRSASQRILLVLRLQHQACPRKPKKAIPPLDRAPKRASVHTNGFRRDMIVSAEAVRAICPPRLCLE